MERRNRSTLIPSLESHPGETIDMWCYYNNADEVELWINGVSQGTRSKGKGEFHTMWRVTFEPGEVRVVSRKDGTEVASQTIHTAGEPAQIRLTPDRATLHADGRDLSFVTVEILDKDGNLCPNAHNLVHFDIQGNAFIAVLIMAHPSRWNVSRPIIARHSTASAWL